MNMGSPIGFEVSYRAVFMCAAMAVSSLQNLCSTDWQACPGASFGSSLWHGHRIPKRRSGDGWDGWRSS